MSPSFKLVLSGSRAQQDLGTCTHGTHAPGMTHKTPVSSASCRGVSIPSLLNAWFGVSMCFRNIFPCEVTEKPLRPRQMQDFGAPWASWKFKTANQVPNPTTGCFAEQDITGPRGDKCPFDLTTLQLPSGVRDPSWFAVAKFDLSKGSSVDLQHFWRGCNSFRTIHPGTSHAPTRRQKMGISGS